MNQDLRDLLAVWLGSEPPAEQADRLLARLRDDGAFRQAFVAEIHLLGQLQAVQSSEPRWLALEDELGWARQDQSADEALETRVLDEIAKLPLVEPPVSTTRGSRHAWAWVAAASLLLLAAGAAALVILSRRTAPAPADPVPVAVQPTPSPGLAVVVRLDDVVWEPGDNPRPAQGTAVPAGHLRLKSGRVALAFLTGVTLYLEGPAELELLTADRVACHHGKFRSRVPLGAEGFTLLTPGAAIVDLGNDLAVNVRSDGRTELLVFEGRAEVSILNAEGHTLRSDRLLAQRPVEVDANTHSLLDVARKPDHFAAAPDLAAPPLVLDRTYAAAVLQSRPWGYWRFEALNRGAVANEVEGHPSLVVRGPLRLDGVPGGNQGIVFGPEQPRQSLTLDGSWKPPRGTGYAVEFWFLAESYGTSSLVSLIAASAGPAEKHAFLVELTAQSRTWVHEPCTVRFLERWPPNEGGGVNLFSRRRYIPFRWHHLAAQKVEDHLELYLDGELHGIALVDPLDATTDFRLLVGRLKQWPQPTPQQARPFVGRIDELAVYDRPLTPDEIRRRYELGRPGLE